MTTKGGLIFFKRNSVIPFSFVQLMAIGQFGNGGKGVQRHAMEERRNVIEVVPIPRLQMVEENAQQAERWK